MTVAELLTQLQAALDRGLPPTTTVVIANNETDWYDIIADANDPSEYVDTDKTGRPDMWFTLYADGEADCRLTPGGM